jgi:type VI secretion system secreted protein VgrG
LRDRHLTGPVVDHVGFKIELTALSTDAHQSLTALLGQPARLDLLTSQSRTALRPFHGHITRIERLGANGGFARYGLTIEPWLAFLGHNRDSYIFQDKTVVEIVDEVLGRWSGQGTLVPAWRWALADASLYPKRGTTAQYQESDLAFLKRLLAEEGLFTWFEHSTEDSATPSHNSTLGKHTLILADHNGAFADNTQPTYRYTQPGATLEEDSLDRWRGERRLDSTEQRAGSWDYRSLSGRDQSAVSAIDNGDIPSLPTEDDPGQYAWQSLDHGERMQRNQRDALDARAKTFHGEGTVRSAAPGTVFTLADHAEHDRDDPSEQRFLITRVVHHARNNLSEIVPDALDALGPVIDDKTVDLYRNQLDAIRATIPWRPLLADGHGRWLHPRPTVTGTQTASRQTHPSGADNAPADDSLGVWLRVMTPAAGGNWGGHLTPRPGQDQDTY